MIEKTLCPLVAVLWMAVPAFGQFLEPGDSDQDYDFDPYDIVLMQQAGKFGTGRPATWQEGDWDGAPGGEAGAPPAGDGVVDRDDIEAARETQNYLAGVYARVVPTPLGASRPLLPGGASDDGQTSIAYFNHTGVLAVDAPNGRALSTILIESKSGIFNGAPAENVGASAFDIDTDRRIFRTVFGGGFTTFSLGAVAETQHSPEFLLNDLSVSGALVGGGDLGPVDLVFLGPPLPDVEAGDADLDYDVDPYDLVQVLQAGKFGTGEPASWEEGDWNGVAGPPDNPPEGDGFFDEDDLAIMAEVGQYRQGPYGPQETPRGRGQRVFAGGTIGDDKVSIVYVAETGELALDVPPGVRLTSIVIDSSPALLGGVPSANLDGPFDVANDSSQLVKIGLREGFTSLSFGRVAAAGQVEGLIARNFSASGSRFGGGGLGVVDLVYLDAAPGFRRGDVNVDGRVDIGDLAFLYHALVPSVNRGLFPCLAAADTNGSTSVGLTDTAALIRWLAGGSLAPVAPGPFECGEISEIDAARLTCSFYPASLCGVDPRPAEDDRFEFRFLDVPEFIDGAPGTTTTFEAVVAICNALPLRAWSVGVVAERNVRIVDVRTVGTLANPDDTLANRAVVEDHSSDEALSFVVIGTKEFATLPPTATGAECEPRDVLILTIEATVPPAGAAVGSLELVERVDFTGWAIGSLVSYHDDEGPPKVARPVLERRRIAVGSPPCPPDRVRCTGLTVNAPVGNGPGVYEVIMATADGGESPLYELAARNTATGRSLSSGVQNESSAAFELTEGEWIFSGAVTDGFECIGSACEEVNVFVQCVEEPDSLSISGLTEAPVGSVVEVVATFHGLDEGAVVNAYTWEITAGEGELAVSEGPVARLRSDVPGEVVVRVIAGDSLCRDVSLASHRIVFREECPASLRADCQRIIVSRPPGVDPEDDGPGEYLFTVGATFPAGFQPLYFFRIENAATGEVTDAGPVPARTARITNLPPGRWIISAAAGVEPECPFDACPPVELGVRCLEQPDSVAVTGADEAQVGDVVEVTAVFDGADAGGAVSHEWEIVSGAGEIVGASDAATARVRSARGGEVLVRVRSGDGVCDDEVEAVHAILFQDCAPPGSVRCQGVEIEGPPANAPGEYRFSVAATVPEGQSALFVFQIENLETRERGSAGPGTFDQATATLSAGIWEIRVSVGIDVDCPFVSCEPVRFEVTEEQAGEVGPFVRGDCNADQTLSVADAVCVLDWLLADGADPGCVASANINGDADVDASDAVYLLLFGFASGAPPVAPFPECGSSSMAVDRTVGCESPPSYCQ